MVVLAAAVTERIHVGVGVMVLALRDPAWAAKQLATLQHVSAARASWLVLTAIGDVWHAQWELIAEAATLLD